ncbi:MAG TPA: SUMF1/EgtB/PvdO family nonheme iron enzyme, partial [Anaerolineales bacterium]|nr:SUMF1/EgtB/PvdO family nonheme iron enzyme [Anaerolineales bacterium]
WWCVEEGQDVKEDTRDLIETRSIKLLQSNRLIERRRAVQTLTQIKNERAIEPLLLAAGDDDDEVASLSVQALIEMEESVRPVVRKAWQEKERRTWHGSIRYLAMQTTDLLWTEIPIRVLEEVVSQSMVWVAPGSFLMGSDKRKDPAARDAESPQHSLTLLGYWIGRTPVTVAQWREFIKENDYKADEKSLRDADDHPVRYVNWDDAMAYCAWLSEKSGLPVTLPSEAEWEKAARGTDGLIYPWGDAFDKDKCNTSESGIGNTTPVGNYSPDGDSPYGCVDMAGNVWEWTRSKFESYPYDPDDGREDLEGRDIRVVRGGSWDNLQDLARASFRDFYNYPNYRYFYYGFRLVVRPPSL